MKKSILCGLVLTFVLQYGNQLCANRGFFGPRRLIAFFDPHGQEIPTSQSFAIMASLIAGLEQQTTPIIISESLWNNFVIRRHRYEALATGKKIETSVFSDLMKKYDKLLTGKSWLGADFNVLKFIEKMQSLYQTHYKKFQEIQKTIQQQVTPEEMKDPFFTAPSSLITALQKIEITEDELQHNHPLRKEIDLDALCYHTNFNPNEWIIRNIPDFAFVLVPKSYIKKIQPDLKNASVNLVTINPKKTPELKDATIFSSITPEGSMSKTGLTVRELLLGLKVDHLNPVADPLQIPKFKISAKQAQTTDDIDLSQIFVTRVDLGLLTPVEANLQKIYQKLRTLLAETYNNNRIKMGLATLTEQENIDQFERYLGGWNIYLKGHGSADNIAFYKQKLAARQAHLKLYSDQIEATEKNIKKYEQKFKKYKKKWKKAKIDSYEEETYWKQRTIAQDTIRQFESLKRKVESKLKNTLAQTKDLIARIQSGQTGGTIAGLYIDEFKELTSFLNTYVYTRLFFYDTCFAGGQNLKAPYQYEDIQESFNYTIASGAISDAPTTVRPPNMALPPYTQSGLEFLDAFGMRSGKASLKLQLDQDFTKFFEMLELYQAGTPNYSYQTLADILNTIHRFKFFRLSPRHLHNIPLVRYPNTQWFKVVDMPQYVDSITEQSIITKQADGTTYTFKTKDALLLYTSHIPVPITIDGPKMPALISMIGGEANHYIAELNATEIPLSEVIKACMPIEDQYFTKRFFIKKLTCYLDDAAQHEDLIKNRKGNVVTLHNVLIINNDKTLFDKNVNVVFILLKGLDIEGELYRFATWATTQMITSTQLLEKLSLRKKINNFAKVKNTIENIMQTPKAREKKIKRRKRVIRFIKQKTAMMQKAAPLLQTFKAKQQEGQEALEMWFDALPEGERRIIAIIKRSEELPTKPILTKKEFEEWHKGLKPKTPQPPQQLPLKNALGQLQRALNNLKNKLAA